MPILLKYQLTEPPDPQFPFYTRPPGEAFVFMTVDHIDDNSRIEYEGPETLVRQIEFRLLRSYGFRGRLMEEWVTPRDLACAMACRLMLEYQPRVISGQEVFDNGRPA